jgi:hypothetical protein
MGCKQNNLKQFSSFSNNSKKYSLYLRVQPNTNSMKKALFKPLLLLIVLGSIFSVTIAFKEHSNTKVKTYISVDTLLKEHKISFDIKGKGGYQENCIQFDIKNLTKDTIYLLIEQGRRFVSNDSSLQDILLVKKQELSLPPQGKSVRPGYGFCCEATMKAPFQNAVFNTGFIAPKEWIKVLDLINTYDFEKDAIQSAIWVLSNDHPLSSVISNNPENQQRLRNILAKVKGIEVPWYSVSYRQDTARVFTDQHVKVWGNVDYQVKHNATISVNVRSLDGMVMKTLVEEMPVNPGYYTYKMDLPVFDWPKGEYEIGIFEDGANLLVKKQFKL